MGDVALTDRPSVDFDKIQEDMGVSFSTPEELADLMEKNPDVWSRVMNEIGNPGSADQSPETEDKNPDEIAATVEGKDGDAGNEDPDKKEDDYIPLDGHKIKPEWLGTYMTKDRSLSEAIEEMHKGNVQKDKTINFYKLEKLPLIEKEKEEARLEAQRVKDEFEKFKKEIEEKNSQKPEDKKQPDDTKIEDEEIVLPEPPQMPVPPSPLEGDDLYDDEKVKQYKQSFEEYKNSVSEFQNKFIEFNDLKSKKAIQDAIKESSKKYSTIEQQFSEFKKEKEQQTEKETQTATERENAERVQREYEEIESLRATNADVLGGARPVSKIEADYIEFLSNIASVAGITGGIYKDGTGKLRQEVVNAFNHYQNPASPNGQSLRDMAEQKGISLPEDYDVLRKVYAIRKVRNNNLTRSADGKYVPMSYDQAFQIAKLSDPTLDVSLVQSKKRDDAVDEHNKKEIAAGKKDSFAKEAPPSASGAKPIIDNITTKDFGEILLKPEQLRTENDLRILWSVVDSKKVPPSTFGLDPSKRPGAK